MTPNSILAIVELLQNQLESQTDTIAALRKKNAETHKQLREAKKDLEQAQEVARRFNDLYIKALRKDSK
jgi:multidrug resistance efflux pump